jgi:hypothetical protein
VPGIGPGWFAGLVESVLYAPLGWGYFALLTWMLIYCLRNDPERNTWLWVMIIFQPLGVIIYFFARWLPSSSLQPPKFIQKLLRGREIERKRIAASQIGNAHQFVELADTLKEVGRLEDARDAYASALAKDSRHIGALWGAAAVDYRRSDFPAAREKLSQVLAIDPAYKFGDVSLLYANTLIQLGEMDVAREHLEQHTKRWRHPESLFRLAEIRVREGNVKSARDLLNALIMDVDGSPRAIARRFYFWKGRAKRLLRKLPAA